MKETLSVINFEPISDPPLPDPLTFLDIIDRWTRQFIRSQKNSEGMYITLYAYIL